MTKKSLIAALALGAGLALTGAYAQQQKKTPEIIATFEYKSNRPEPKYRGKTFVYNFLDDGSIIQANHPNVKFASLWFYDINGNGKLDEAELKFIKSGGLIYMHPKFNELANKNIKSVVRGLLEREAAEVVGLENSPKLDTSYSIPNLEFPIPELKAEPYKPIDMSNEGLSESFSAAEENKRLIRTHVIEMKGNSEEALPAKNNFYESHPNTQTSAMIPKPKEKKLTLTVDGGITLSEKIKGYDGEIGLRYDFGDFGIGAKLGVGKGSGEELVDSYEGAVSATTGRQFKGKVTSEEILRLKASLEAKLGFFLAEGGVVYIPTNKNVLEQLYGRNGNVLKENSYSFSENVFNYFGGAGVEVGEEGKGKLRLIVGGETGKGLYIKSGFEIPLSKK